MTSNIQKLISDAIHARTGGLASTHKPTRYHTLDWSRMALVAHAYADVAETNPSAVADRAFLRRHMFDSHVYNLGGGRYEVSRYMPRSYAVALDRLYRVLDETGIGIHVTQEARTAIARAAEIGEDR